MWLRSTLYAPGNVERLLDKVFSAGADSVILDLEDAVPYGEKASARDRAAAAISRHSQDSVPIFVRMNAVGTAFMRDDLQAVVRPGLTGVKIPKVESAAQVAHVDDLLTSLERERDLATSSICVVASIETAAGVENAGAIARAARRLWCLSFGSGDYALDTGCALTPEGTESLYARSQLVVASRAAGLAPPFDSVYPRLDDEDGLLANARSSKALGFQGKSVIHPKQIGPVHAVYTPTPEEVERARHLVDTFRAAEARGSASFQLDGVFVDYAIVRRAEQLLAVSDRIAHHA